MRWRLWVYLMGTLLAGITLFGIPHLSKDIRPIPEDSLHEGVWDPQNPKARVEDCQACHAPQALPPNHPSQVTCLVCHAP